MLFREYRIKRLKKKAENVGFSLEVENNEEIKYKYVNDFGFTVAITCGENCGSYGEWKILINRNSELAVYLANIVCNNLYVVSIFRRLQKLYNVKK